MAGPCRAWPVVVRCGVRWAGRGVAAIGAFAGAAPRDHVAHRAEHRHVDRAQCLQRVTELCAAGPAIAHHDDGTVGEQGCGHPIGDWPQRGRVDDDGVELAAQPRGEVGHLAAAQQFGGVRRERPAREHVQLLLAPCPQRRIQGDLLGEYVAEPGGPLDPQVFGDLGPAQVRVDQKGLAAGLGERQREVDRDSRPAFGRLGRHDSDHLHRAIPLPVLQACPELAHLLGEDGTAEVAASGRQRPVAPDPADRHEHTGAGGGHLLVGADGRVEQFAQRGPREANHEANQNAEQVVERAPWRHLDRACRPRHHGHHHGSLAGGGVVVVVQGADHRAEHRGDRRRQPDRTGRGGVGSACGQQHRIQAGRAADLRGYRMRRRVQPGLRDHSAGQLVATEQLDVGVHERLRVEIRLVRLARLRRRRCDEERHRTAILLRLKARNPDRSRGADYGNENNHPPALANR